MTDPVVLKGRNLESELIFSASRSSGPGGQNVNKVSTRIELRFDVGSSKILNEEEKNLLFVKLANRLTKEGTLIIVSQVERSQFDNKTRTIERFYQLLEKALTPVKKRTPTKPTFASKKKRLENKIHRSEKKALRKINYED
jgi:ribosome-associated protein